MIGEKIGFSPAFHRPPITTMGKAHINIKLIDIVSPNKNGIVRLVAIISKNLFASISKIFQ
jgi:hypothetical protein